MSRIAEYKATVKASWIHVDEEIAIEPSTISYIMFDYDYDKNNMPVAYVMLNIKTSIYNQMVQYVDESAFYLEIHRYNTRSANPVHNVDIKEQFRYYIPSDQDYTEPLTDAASRQISDESSYVRATIGLIKVQVLDDNMRHFDDMVYSGNLSTLIYNGLNHVQKLCINELLANKELEYEDIPPLASVKEYLTYIDDEFGTYENGFRYFHDYDIAYMLDEEPRYVPNGTNQYADVYINIEDLGSELASNGGIVIDSDNALYMIYVEAHSTGLSDNTALTSTVDHRINIGDQGEIKSIPISQDVNVISTKRVKKNKGKGKAVLKQMPMSQIAKEKQFVSDSLKVQPSRTDKVVYKRSDSSGSRFSILKNKTTVTVTKPQLDGHLFTPNKIYHVRNFKTNEQFDGEYILWQKKVVYQMEDGDFVPTTSLTLRKRVV